MLNLENYHNEIVTCKLYEDVEAFNSTFKSKGTVFLIINQNIRSYNSNIDEFLIILESFDIKFNCIVLTEAWLTNDSDLIHMEGYNMFRSHNSLNNNDGVVVYIDNRLSVTCRQLLLGGVATSLSLTFDWAGCSCELLATYRSPSSNIYSFIEGVSSHYRENTNGSKLKIFCGDINCNTLKVTPNSPQDRYLDVMYELNLLECVNKVTRPASNSCIDHFFINSVNNITANSSVIQTDVTDHNATILNLTAKRSSKTKELEESYLKRDWRAISADVTDNNWESVCNNTNLNSAVNSFEQVLCSIIQKHSTRAIKTSKCCKLKSWITTGLINSIRYRDKIRKIIKKQPFNIILRNHYTRYRNVLKSTIKRAKFEHYKSQITEADGDSRKFWSTVNDIAGRPSRKEPFPIKAFCESSPDGIDNAPDTVKEISNAFNQYFANVGSQLASAINPTGPPGVEDADYALDSVFELRPVTHQELYDCVMSMRGHSAPGCDGIPVQFIKDNFYALSDPMLHIINLSIRTGKFPDAFKTAKVIPIFKTGLKSIKNNYRPISLLNSVSKVIERLVKSQLIVYLEKENIISSHQFGFRSNKNTSDALFELSRCITSNIASKKRVLITFLDLAKAFDSVDRGKLLAKLQYIGIKNKEYEWFSSYLQCRKQRVCINNTNSDSMEVDYGVIQGSTLGPLLFLVYINNLSVLDLTSKLLLFADDTAIITEGRTWDETFNRASIDLTKVKNWFDNNTLSVNISKTKCLPIHLRQDCGPGALTLRMHSCGVSESDACGCAIIERVEQYTYLGVIIDSRLSWTPHIQYIKQRLRKFIYAFSQLSQVLSVEHCRTVYCAYVQSLLEYGVLVWGGLSSTALEPLAVTQRSIIKTILKKNSRYPTDLLFQDFPVLNIRQLFIKNMLLFVRTNKEHIFTVTQHDYSTRIRNNYGYEIPRLNLTTEKHNSFYLAHVVYRNIPPEVINAESGSRAVYKRTVSKWLLRIGPAATEALVHSNYNH